MIALIWAASLFVASTFGFIIAGTMRTRKLDQARDVNGKLVRTLRETCTILRLAGLNSGADLAINTIEELKEEFPC